MKKTAASRLAALKAVEHACECIFAVTPVTRVFNAARDKGPLHAEASGHPKVGSAESRLNERLADSSAPMLKFTSSKRGNGSFDDLAGGSDDEYRNGISDDLDYQIRRTYGVAASVAPKLPNLLGNFR